jgi:hypothetical protein
MGVTIHLEGQDPRFFLQEEPLRPPKSLGIQPPFACEAPKTFLIYLLNAYKWGFLSVSQGG